MKKHIDVLIIVLIFTSIAIGVFSNIKQEKAVDKSKLPTDVENDRMFQRWITNLKNKGLNIEADEFKLKESNEIYNTTWMTVSSIDEIGKKEEFESVINAHKDIKKVAFSPSEKIFVDYRNIDREDILSNQVRLYGLKEDKIIDARILDCSVRANCYFDRAYFIDNDVFVISEFSRNISKKDSITPICSKDQLCTYTVKVHVIDLMHNVRDEYESNPFDIILNEWINFF
ncbi:hypothetical protein GYA37_02285 [candidate division WWE3 bacterium]|uniref:Uncharacterized protein n=1 Tax=candidate division WWE3 bacterium TaxID=2053526 RepID=A0A7X9HSN6_UNCKA|nr:hypothetical protein [candidate division WWE3 bacterium]